MMFGGVLKPYLAELAVMPASKVRTLALAMAIAGRGLTPLGRLQAARAVAELHRIADMKEREG